MNAAGVEVKTMRSERRENSDEHRIRESAEIQPLFGRVMRETDSGSQLKEAIGWKPAGKSRMGRPRKRWVDGVERVPEKRRVRNWRETVRDRNEWAGGRQR